MDCFRRKRTRSKILTMVLTITMVMSSFVMAVPAFAADQTAPQDAIVFDNTGAGEDAISLLDARSFTAKVKVDMTKEELEKAITDGAFQWTLSRGAGMQDASMFPYQYLGGKLEDWKCEKTEAQERGPLFENIKQTAVAEGDAVYLQLSFDAKTMFGYNGVDGRGRKVVRNKVLDYTGEYTLACTNGDVKLGETSVWVRPYDSFYTQSQVDKKMDELAARANAAGIYGKVEQIGTSSAGYPMRAIFVSASSSDLSNSQALSKRAESEPAKVQSEIKNGSLKYKVPVMYSNVHADEIIGPDSCLDFVEALVEAAEGDGKIPYTKITGLTSAGTAAVKSEMAERGKVWSELIKDKVTGVGYIRGNGKVEPTSSSSGASSYSRTSDATVNMTDEEMAKYYNMKDTDLNVKDVLDDIFFIVVPSENVDGRTNFTRTNSNYFDLNRDNTYQTQAETQAMTALIAKWNPVSFHEIHGFYEQFQVEPCSPTHEPNAEYDLFMDTALAQGENFGSTAIANNEKINSFQVPMRDYLEVDKSGKKNWIPFDDMSTSYTPQYAFLHGVNAFTVEVPYGSQEAVDAIKYGFIGNAAFVAENKDRMFTNQLEFYRRGMENIDSDAIRPWYVSQSDEIGAEADVFRKKYKENDNFFPEYYIIPMTSSKQQDMKAAKEMVEYLLRNDVKLKKLTADVKINGVTYVKGSIVVDMHQAKRNMANAALYTNVVITDWNDLYSEPLTAFSQLRGFDMAVITKKGAIKSSNMQSVTKAPTIKSAKSGSGNYTILRNNSVDAIQVVNALLKKGKSVGMVTSGTYKGEFLVSTADFNSVKNQYILKGYSVKTAPKAKVIKKSVKVYIPGRTASPFESNVQGAYGVKNYSDRLNTSLGWDLFAYGKQMGFTIVSDPAKADVIVGNRSLTDAEINLVKEGKPYVGYTANALKAAKAMGIGVEYVDGGGYDALTTVTYESDSLITAKYKKEKDFIMYGYGGNYITSVPEGAKVLVKTTSDYPIEGFMSSAHIEKYKNTVQAIDYAKNGMKVTLFANTLTNKAHQQDDYRFAANAIYEKMLGEDFANAKTIKGVKNTTISAKSAKAEKGIKVSWKKSGSYKVDKYQVYRSTKKSSYGTKAYYVTKNAKTVSFTDSKSLKKGTRYYYKVRGVRKIDGKTYYTKWSNQANRVYK